MYRSIVGVAVLLAAGSTWADDGVAEQKRFAGAWKVAEGSADGRALPDEAKKSARLLFDGNHFAFRGGPVEPYTTYSVDPARQTIEIAPPKGETRTLRGRYKFEGTTLTLCLTDATTVPEKMVAGPDRLLLVLVRDK